MYIHLYLYIKRGHAESLRGSSVKHGTTQRRLERPLHKDDTR